jgi:hypothetical protein
MRECTERLVKIGFRRNPKKIFDEVEAIAARMIREGWFLRDTMTEDGLGNIHLFFERDISLDKGGMHINKGDVDAV